MIPEARSHRNNREKSTDCITWQTNETFTCKQTWRQLLAVHECKGCVSRSEKNTRSHDANDFEMITVLCQGVSRAKSSHTRMQQRREQACTKTATCMKSSKEVASTQVTLVTKTEVKKITGTLLHCKNNHEKRRAKQQTQRTARNVKKKRNKHKQPTRNQSQARDWMKRTFAAAALFTMLLTNDSHKHEFQDNNAKQ